MQVPGVFKYFVALQAGRVEWWSDAVLAPPHRGTTSNNTWLEVKMVLAACLVG